MDKKRIFRDIAALVEGDVLYDDLTLTLYSSAACLFRVKPLAVVQPKSKSDVVKLVRYAGAQKIPLTARGGGTSRAGNELGEGIIVDFSRHMNRILEANPAGMWARVETGVMQGALNKAIKSHAIFYPIDPSTKEHCTIGGMVANNSSGPHAVKYGATRDTVLSLELVLASGDVISTGPVTNFEAEGLPSEIYRKMDDILTRYKTPLEEEKPYTVKNSSGYDLWRLRTADGLDLTSLFVGSEGTIGLITEATLRLSPLPGRTLGGLVYFDDLEKVGPATVRILESTPTMLEIIERRILDLARQQKAELRPYLPEGAEAVLFIEFEGGGEDELHSRFAAVEKDLLAAGLAIEMRVAKDARDMAMLEKVRSVSGPILNKTKGPKRPVAFIEDAAVHPSRLPQYIKGLRQIFKRYDVDAGIYGHAGDGNMHLMVFLDLRRQEEVRKMVALADAAYDLVLSLKGTISGEHGDGRLRTYYTKRQYPRLYEAFKEIKALFDPDSILNPGSIVGGDENPLPLFLKFKQEKGTAAGLVAGQAAREAVEACSGCGKCRFYCPIAMEVMEEWVMGRAKASLIREYLTGTLDEKIVASPRFREVLDSCVNCKRCLTECPSGADIPWVALSGRALAVDLQGEPLSRKLMGSTHFLCETGSTFAPLSNAANNIAPLRRGLEALTGLDRRRRLPSFQRKTLRKWMEDRPRQHRSKQVAYFLSCYANFNDPEGDGLATVEVLERNGFEVLLPDFPCCGVARLSSGAVNAVSEDIRTNVRLVAGLAAKGIPVVFSEPSCALAVKMEYPRIEASEETLKAERNCYDIYEFLMGLHKKGELDTHLARMDLKVGYHNPCHLRALGVTSEPADLLRMIPGVEVKVYSDQCCGIAGTFGLKKKNYDLSMTIGQRLFKEIAASKVDRVATSCGACAIQITQGTGRKAVTPVALLAASYRQEEQPGKEGCEASLAQR